MHRVQLELIQQNSTIPLKELTQIINPSPASQGWFSQKFPLYPVIFNFYLYNPPFNKISLSFQPKPNSPIKKPFLPSKIIFYGSQDAVSYFKILELVNINKKYEDLNQVVYLFEEHHLYHYIRIKIQQPLRQQSRDTNPCKQIYIRAIEFTDISVFNMRFVCSLKNSLKYSPTIFKLLEILEYKGHLYEVLNDQRYIKYYQVLDNLLNELADGINVDSPPKQYEQKLQIKLQQLIQQPLNIQIVPSSFPENKNLKQQIKKMQGQLSEFYVNRLNNLSKQVTDYFGKYWNVTIKEIYLRYLSSPDENDHKKALTQFWAEVKVEEDISDQLQEAIIMFLNYFLQQMGQQLKITAMKILTIFLKRQDIGAKLHSNLYQEYERIMFNLINQLNCPQNSQIYSISLKCLFFLFDKVPNDLFVTCLLNHQTSTTLEMKLVKLFILEKITFKNVQIKDLSLVANFLLDLLEKKQLSLSDKNKVYNVVAYLAIQFDKETVMAYFEKLNSMILVSMQGIIDKKMQLLQLEPKKKQTQLRQYCEFCGQKNTQFKQEDIYDLHLAKQCRYMTLCKYCRQIVQVPKLFQHYISQCEEKKLFKRCENCNDAILIASNKQHNQKCKKKLETKCPLCDVKFNSKLDLKAHLIKGQCPNNQK